MDFKSFLIGFVVSMFVSFITSLIREKFLKSPKKNKDRSN
ncbi:PncF family bacteriocin immunity protein [Streptococcus mitis]|uniref:Bacteriocin n=1 Tax=Streptococcus mitis TaxID=28037 RepID=A0AAX0NC95_STRMT|nr:PncF family bacteriocin immunity protein [Streptococcus mitis]MCG4864935.1 bacteriocin [Streptococcus mitis]MDU4845375.1 PncF family bacteriocin immunity protein [Streptococcus mitis]MDU6722523.1 PncF family bacteriocin immunity protein [Streptococcus mitis]MQQ67529.1 bacteriocin [Streptococcus mitis]ORO90042.1 bacteriocin [Streptococcus mitis]